jgi:single-stranded-DNA-specific exonuclease
MAAGLADLVPKEMLERVQRGVALVERVRRVRILGHYDPDGTTAAALLARAMLRAGKAFHASTSTVMDEALVKRVNDEGDELVIVSDMGSGQLALVETFACPAIVLDHHKPLGDSEAVVHVNPALHGFDGTREACGATTSWLLALALDDRNWDLAGVAMAGAIGDMQHLGGFSGLNKALFDEALARKVVSRERALALVTAPVDEALARSVTPYFTGISGRVEGARKLLTEMKIDPQVPLNELVPEERHRLTSVLATLLLRQGADAEAVESLVKEKFWSVSDGVYADELSAYVDGCARLGHEGLGIALCLGDKEAFSRAEDIRKRFDDRLLSYLQKLETEGPFTKKHVQFFYTDEPTLAGSVAGIAMKFFLDQAKPTLGLTVLEKTTKVSARATRELIAKGIDLAVALREASAEMGGDGGGHNIASGATIPKGKEEKFLTLVDETVGRQLAPKAG